MAALLDEFVLANLSSKFNILSVERSPSSNNILATFEAGFINEYNVDDQKLIHSWPVRHGVNVTSPGIWCDEEEEYICVFNQQEIRRWNVDDNIIEKTRKKNIKTDIYKVFTTEGYKPIVLCKNGAAEFIENIKSICETPVIGSQDSIVYADIIKKQNGFGVIYLVESKNKRTLHCQWYLDDVEQWKHQTFVITYQKTVIDYCCHTDENSNTCLFLLGSEKDLYRINIKESSIEEEFISVIHELGTEASIVCLDNSQIVIAGLLKKGQNGVGIFDTKYCAVQSFKPFPEICKVVPRVFCLNNHIFMNCGKKLYAFPYQFGTSTLSEFLGKSRSVEDNTNSSLHIINWSTKLKSKGNNTVKQLETILNDLIDPSKTQNKSKFSDQFKIFLECLIKGNNSSSISSLQMIQLCQRCLSERKFWPSEELRQLLNHGYISSGISSELIEVLIEKKENSLLHLSLQKLSEIPEACLIQILQYYIGLSDEDFQKNLDIDISTVIEVNQDKCPFGALKAHFIREVLSQPFSDIFLIDKLRKLNFKNVLSLLDFLFYLMATDDNQAVSFSTRPQLQNVIDWISCTIDAHVTQLILSPDARVLLIKLHESVSQQTQFYDGMIELEALLSQYKSKLSNPIKPKIGQYCIEVLHIY
ncbi:hypothetical protein SNE40_018954 [Patella caerulea]|uniref:Nucleolar protein 11 n=1 Tax=Patella caerulea TaxID=87958 RepID=A0AAN8J5T9_PATCE